VFNRNDRVKAEIVDEVSRLETLDRLAIVFSPSTRDALRGALRDYARQVVTVEWPRLRSRSVDILTMPALDSLDATYSAVEPVTKKQQKVMNYAKSLLARIRDDRSLRVMRSAGILEALLLGAVVTASVVALVFPFLFGSPNVNATLLMSIVSTFQTATVVLVVLKLSFPFSGPDALPPTPYVDFLQEAAARPG
jgi:hypothetical protein